MITHPAFNIDPWGIHESKLDLDVLAHTESIFSLSNGHIGLRGNLDEGEPYAISGSYLNSFYELGVLPYPEGGYGYPESGQQVVNVANGKLIRILVDDEPFDLRYGTVHSHKRSLDFRSGLLRRDVRWTSPVGTTIKVSSTRMVSFTQRAVAAICYEVEAVDAEIRIVLQSELVANEEHSAGSGSDPRAGTLSVPPLISEEYEAKGTVGLLVHRTQASKLRMGATMDHHLEGPKDMAVEAESYPDVARVSVTCRLKPGERLRVIKFLSYGWSSQRSRSAIHDQIIAARTAARLTGWEGLLEEQRTYLKDFWARADVEIEGDPEIQQAIRFALFHVIQAGSRGERRPIPAKGLTGPGYDGHVFWDTETFVLPLLTLTHPQAAADALYWRHSTLDLARTRARQFNLNGAAFPWRTIHGEECSGYWPAGTAAFHINADIAYAVAYYVACTGDMVFEEQVGLELLAETARLWYSLGCYNGDLFCINGVTGPDEYSAIVDNNVYTNLMAQRNLRAAASSAKRHPKKAKALGIKDSEITHWRDAGDRMFIPEDKHLHVTPQDDAFAKHEKWDFDHTTPDKYPLFLNFPYFDIYRKQVIKQADLVLAMLLCGESFTQEQKQRNFAYYEPLTVRDSSLSAPAQAAIAAEVGQLDLAYDYLGESIFMDLNDLEHNVKDGLHIASLAGGWVALIKGFGGLRLHDDMLSFKPCVPAGIERLSFHVTFHGCHLRIDIMEAEATYRILDDESCRTPLHIKHYGEKIMLSAHKAVTRPIPAIKAGPRPTQPAGREPTARKKRSSSSSK